jgi:hypothetical protein
MVSIKKSYRIEVSWLNYLPQSVAGLTQEKVWYKAQ